MSLQWAILSVRPTPGQRCISSFTKIPIQGYTEGLWTQSWHGRSNQAPCESSLGTYRVNLGYGVRRVPVIRNCQVSHTVSRNVALRYFATKAAQQEVGTKWWESLGLFLHGCRRSSKVFNVRRLLWKLGIPYWKVEKRWKKTRRAYKHSWLSTMVSAGCTVAIGDIIAQTVYPVLFGHSKSNKNVTEKDIRRDIDKICSNMKQINVCRTLQFAILAAVFVGPLSKFVTNRFMVGTLRYPEGSYTAQLIMKDAFLLTPLVIASYMIGYDYRAAVDTTKKVTEVSNKDKNKGVKDMAAKRISLLRDEVMKRYKKAFMDMFIFYVTTAPFVKMVQAFGMVPKKNGQLLGKLYKLIFYCFLSHSITSNQLGPEITKSKTLKEIKNGNKGGGGGWVCITAGAIADTFKKSKT